MGLVLTFDVGTQSLRAMLVNTKGDIVEVVGHKYEKPYFSKQPDWAEQKAEYYFEVLCECSLKLKEKSGKLWDDIIAVTVTTVRDTCVCVDNEGTPLRDIIVWLDKREAKAEEKLPFYLNLLYLVIGMKDTIDMQRKVSVCNWIIENEPEVWQKTYKYLMLSGYLNFLLTGNMVDSSAGIIGHIPFDSKVRGWMKKGNIKRVIYDVEEEKLCDVIEPGDIVGTITEKASQLTGIKEGLELIATGADKGCETLGVSCISEDSASVSFGTTATLECMTKKYVEPIRFVPAFPAVMKGYYNPEVMVYRGYWLITWFKREFAKHEVEQAEQLGISAEQLLNERLREIPAGCDGLVMEPYFSPGVTMPKAKGAVIGFSDVHTRIHLYRSIIEGINFALIEGMQAIEKRGNIKVKKLFVSGGGSQSSEICQITANMFNLPVYRIQTNEASGLGSSIVAFVSKGYFDSYEQAVKSMVHVRDEFLPDQNEAQKYNKILNKVFKKIYKKLLPLYKKQSLIK